MTQRLHESISWERRDTAAEWLRMIVPFRQTASQDSLARQY